MQIGEGCHGDGPVDTIIPAQHDKVSRGGKDSGSAAESGGDVKTIAEGQ